MYAENRMKTRMLSWKDVVDQIGTEDGYERVTRDQLAGAADLCLQEKWLRQRECELVGVFIDFMRNVSEGFLAADWEYVKDSYDMAQRHLVFYGLKKFSPNLDGAKEIVMKFVGRGVATQEEREKIDYDVIMAMPLRDDIIYGIKVTVALLERTIQMGLADEAERLRAKLRKLTEMI